ncbi:Biotin--protein ligase 1 [Nymphaea thermarum]|nr:Biotin--protein ligase 1 [Nymphaea thermarum]
MGLQVEGRLGDNALWYLHSHQLKPKACANFSYILYISGSKNSYLIVISGKSSSDDEFAFSLKHKKSLKLAEGEEEIQILVHSELQTPCGLQTFQTNLYMKNLSTCVFGRFLIWSPRLPSTHDLVSQNFCELPLGTVCITDIQFKGRGRSKNVWESPHGCLLFSFTLEMDNGHILPLLQYVVSLAIVEAIKVACEAKGLPCLDVKIKWPNDLYLGGLKVGGVLCTSTYRSKKFNVSAGIGLNLDNDMPTTCLNAALQKLTSGSLRLTREEILASFFSRFESLYEAFISQGFQALESLYYKYWMHSGQKVVIEEKYSNPSPENSVVTIQGLTSSGYLLAIDDDNRKYELHPDGNSFDFFKGLIKKKMES